MIVLQVVSNAAGMFERRFTGEEVVVGRSSSADLSVPDPSMSRRHARLRLDGGAWRVEDLESRNGTMLNGSKIVGASPVAAGDILTVGSSRITVMSVAEAEPAHTPDASSHTVFRNAAELLADSSPTPLPERLDREVRRYAERFRLLTEIHAALGRSISLDELLELILDRAFEHLAPEDGALFLRLPDDRYVCAAHRSRRKGDTPPVISMQLLREVAEKGQAALVLDTTTDSRFNQAASLVSAGVRSLVAAPLLDPEGSFGMIVLGSTFGIRQFTEEDMELLTALASVAAMRLRNVRLAEEAAERRLLEEEVALARRIQKALLPERLPEIAGWSLHGATTPSRGVSGDMFRVTLLEDGTTASVLVADVSGKGMAASILTASLEALTAGPIAAGLGPAEVFNVASKLLFARTPPEKYATAFLAEVDTSSGTVRWANAGHNPAVVVRCHGEIETLKATGTPLGLLPVSRYEAREVALQPGEWLVVYTDGITEAESPDEEEYGMERLLALCRAHRAEDATDMAASLGSDVERFVRGVPYADDRTLVILKREGSLRPAPQPR